MKKKPSTIKLYFYGLSFSPSIFQPESFVSLRLTLPAPGIEPGVNQFLPTVAFSQLSSNMCCPRDCVSRHNGGTSGAPLIPPRDDSALIILSCERSPCEGLLYFYYLRQMMHLSNQLNDFFFQHVFLKSPVQREPGLR